MDIALFLKYSERKREGMGLRESRPARLEIKESLDKESVSANLGAKAKTI